MNCLVCKSGTMHEAKETYFANLKNGYLIIENVPCWKCDQCGEVVFSAPPCYSLSDDAPSAEFPPAQGSAALVSGR